ncbi:hypothetical protein [Natronococcus occultus]|uniref:ABC-2 type transport system permease protein n=1 Tax=Natronococcus occultus SP4 TaxID=694430 RepID=L0K1I4_9EURY|nr:hypothetical protein [Natronococcus occultus]AGB38400.1 hypothetical protein Natoc_2638 [Natronococcus occultus SP4]
MARDRLDGGVRIARTEWRRHRREFGGSRGRRVAAALGYCAVAVALGALATAVGRDLATGTPLALSLAAAVAFAWIVARSASLTGSRFEQLAPDALLTAVPVRTAAMGLLVFVAARVGAVLAVPTVGVAVGLALGARTPLVALTAIIAIGALAALAVGVGVASRLGSALVGRRLSRGGLYRDLLVVFGWLPLVALWLLLQELSVSLETLSVWFEWLPLAALADLAVLGAGGDVEPLRAVVTVAGVAVTVPLLAGLTTAFARRLWVTEPADSTDASRSGSHSLLDDGRLEALLGDRVSRPTVTVARQLLLAERRTPRGLLNAGYALAFVGLVGLPLFGVLLGAPGFLLVVFALGVAPGIVFGSEPIGRNYRVLPLLLTAVHGRAFVGGHVLASLVLGVPLVAIVVVPLGIASAATLAETVALVATGVALCCCTATALLAFELTVDREDLAPVPAFFSSVPAYAEEGWSAFVGLAKTFAVVSLVFLPAALGNATAVYERVAELGLPVTAVRLGALGVTCVLALGVSRVAARVAVRRYRDYHLN